MHDVRWYKISDPKWWSRRLEVHLANKLFLLSSWKRIHQCTTCKRSTMHSQNIRMFWFECSFGWKFLFVESYSQDSCWLFIMATIVSKRKLNTKCVKDKYRALKKVEDGKTKLQVTAKYSIPKNTLSIWLKNKDKIFEATKEGSNSKLQRLRQDTFANLNRAMFK